jgi:long-subunit acyl-CoA synthetase (AMP-forming)
MSARLSPTACLNLLEQAECTMVLHGNTSHVASGVAEIERVRGDKITVRPILQRADFDRPDQPAQPPFEREVVDREKEHTEVVFIAHSSGSTGLPKPLFLSHRSLTMGMLAGVEYDAFNALPLYHLHGLLTTGQAIWLRKKACLFGAHMPLTADSLIAGLEAVQPQIAHLVPYTLKLVAEKQRGVDLLRQCKRVTAAGVRTPDELGDRLIENGVNFASMFGL